MSLDLQCLKAGLRLEESHTKRHSHDHLPLATVLYHVRYSTKLLDFPHGMVVDVVEIRRSKRSNQETVDVLRL